MQEILSVNKDSIIEVLSIKQLSASMTVDYAENYTLKCSSYSEIKHLKHLHEMDTLHTLWAKTSEYEYN